MIKVNKGTKKYKQLLWTWENCYKGDSVYNAYKGKISSDKLNSFEEIVKRAIETKGYNYDIKVVAASAWYYSTMYSYTENDQIFVVYDTYANTYILEI